MKHAVRACWYGSCNADIIMLRIFTENIQLQLRCWLQTQGQGGAGSSQGLEDFAHMGLIDDLLA